MQKLEKLIFSISMLDKISQPLGKIQRNIDNLQRNSDVSFRKMAVGFGIVSVALGAFSISSTSKLTELQRQLNYVSDAFNISQLAMQKWQAAGSSVGIQTEQMIDIMKDVNDKIGDFALTGGGGAKDIFETLKLDIKQFKTLSPDKILLKVGAALDKSKLTKSEKIFLMEGLANDASKLLPLLRNNAEQLTRMGDLAMKSGAILTAADSKILSKAAVNIGKMKLAFQGVSTQVGLLGSHFMNAFGAKITGSIRSIALSIKNTWHNTKALRIALMYLGSGSWEQLGVFLSSLSAGFKAAFKPLTRLLPNTKEFLYTLAKIGYVFKTNGDTTMEYGRVFGKIMGYMVAGLVVFKTTLLAVSIATFTLKIAVFAVRVAMMAWNTVIWLTRAALIAVRSVALVGFLTALVTRLVAVRGAMLAWNTVIWLTNSAMWANPVGVVILGITALIAIVGSVIVYWNDFKATFTESQWSSIASTALDILLWPINGLINAVKLVSKGWTDLKAGFSESAWAQNLEAVIRRVQRLITGLVDKWNTVKGMGGVVSNATSNAWQGAKTGVKTAWAETKSVFGGARATGGPVLPGKFYQVNEYGSELLMQGGKTFLMNGAQGQIMPLQDVKKAANDVPSLSALNANSNYQGAASTAVRQLVTTMTNNTQHHSGMQIDRVEIHTNNKIDPTELKYQLEMLA